VCVCACVGASPARLLACTALRGGPGAGTWLPPLVPPSLLPPLPLSIHPSLHPSITRSTPARPRTHPAAPPPPPPNKGRGGRREADRGRPRRRRGHHPRGQREQRQLHRGPRGGRAVQGGQVPHALPAVGLGLGKGLGVLGHTGVSGIGVWGLGPSLPLSRACGQAPPTTTVQTVQPKTTSQGGQPDLADAAGPRHPRHAHRLGGALRPGRAHHARRQRAAGGGALQRQQPRAAGARRPRRAAPAARGVRVAGSASPLGPVPACPRKPSAPALASSPTRSGLRLL
jgi:hypothetical protein